MNSKSLVRFSSFTASLGIFFLLSSSVSAQYCRRGETTWVTDAFSVGARARGGCGWSDGDCSSFDDVQEGTYNAPDGWAIVRYQTRVISSIRMNWTQSSISLIRGGQQYSSSRNSASNNSSQMGGNVNAGNYYGTYGAEYGQSSSSSNNQYVSNSSLVTGIVLRVVAKAEKAFGGGSGSARKETVDVLLRCVN